jgi:Trk K+ transport system NAD-binding subunit
VSRSLKRLLVLLACVPLLLLLSAVLYMLGMEHLEGQPRTFLTALEWAAETLTTTGYGADASWQHPAMVVFTVVLQFAGVFLVFLIVPVYLIPYLDERFQVRIPRSASSLRDHVVVYRFGPAVAGLLRRLAAGGVASVVIEDDGSEAEARRLLESGHRVILGSLAAKVLEAAALPHARALVANGSDSENAAVMLAARQLGFEGETVAFVEEPSHRHPMLLAGAKAAFTPRHILAAALAGCASHRIGPRLAGVQQLGRHLQVSEVRIRSASPLAGRTLEEVEIPSRTGATVIGQWVGGRLLTPPTPAMRIEPGGILVLVSSGDGLKRFENLVEQAVTLDRGTHHVIAGYGEVGRKVAEILRDAGEEVRVVDRSEAVGADVTGSMLDAKIIDAAGVQKARSVVLALDSDSDTLFATVISKEHAPEVPVIARVNEADNVERIYTAGADFALSISQVASQMLVRRLLGEEAIEIDPVLRVQKVSGTPLAGRNPVELRIRERTSCSVVAVERGQDVICDLGPDFRFAADDAVFISGSDEAVRRFWEALGPL